MPGGQEVDRESTHRENCRIRVSKGEVGRPPKVRRVSKTLPPSKHLPPLALEVGGGEEERTTKSCAPSRGPPFPTTSDSRVPRRVKGSEPRE